ncbi:MAG: Obg family GTPase CgtA, partial [Mycoplasmataceae bacterium]|nr:Obg family GTPase CgtA [Mycoplasmataceae bacterium]
TWSVDSPFLDYWHDKIPHTTNDNIIRFTNKIKSLGVENAIIKNGGAIGDTMIICREEYTID